MYRRILIPVDGSTLSERAIAVALSIADRHRASLLLVRVYEPVTLLVAKGAKGLGDPELERNWRTEQERSLTRLARRIASRTTVPVDARFLDGEVVPTLAREVRESACDLAIMCTHGRGGYQRAFLGSVADGLMREIAVPLLLVRGGGAAPRPPADTFPYRRVLVPLDGSGSALGAIDATIRLLGGTPATLILTHVIHPMTASMAEHVGASADARATEEHLEPAAVRARAAALAVEYATVTDARVSRALVALAKEHQADLIAMTTQGLGGVHRFIVGSVADKVIRSASLPVLVCQGSA